MKNYILKTMCLAAGLVSFSACSDFLDQTSPSEYPTQSVYESVGYTEFAINKLYGDMGQDLTNFATQQLGPVSLSDSGCSSKNRPVINSVPSFI